MNLNNQPTLEQLRELVRQCDDSAGHHVLWVKRSGEVAISPIPENQTPIGFQQAHQDMQLRFETFQAGNDYVGPDAADDNAWLTELFHNLVEKWGEAKEKPDVAYVDSF